MNRKRLVAAGLAAVMAVSLAACGGKTDSTQSSKTTQINDNTANSDAANTEKTDETLTISLSSEPSSIVGSLVGESENEGCVISGAILDTLVATDPTTGEVKPRLATEWEWLDDYRVQFTLRDDVVMTDGHTMTSADVVYTVNTLAAQSANGDAGRYFDASKTEAVDDTHVIVAFNTVSPDLIAMLSWTPFGIFSEAEVEAAGGFDAAADKPVIGSGRYRFKEWVAGQYIVLERNDDYWDDDYAGYYKEIKLTFTSDAAARVMQVQSGDAQVTTDIDIAQAATYESDENLSTTFYSFGQVYHLWFNMRDSEAMKNADVRAAIDKALDYQAIAAYATAGQAEESLGYIESDVAFAHDYYTKEERAQDIEGAKELLASAGYGDGLSVKCVGLGDTEGLYTVIQEQLAQAGITLTIESTDTATFVQAANSGDYDLIIVGEYLDTRNPSAFTFFRQANIDTFCIGGPKTTTSEIEGLIDEIVLAESNEAAAEPIEKLMEIFKKDTWVLNLCPQLKAVVTASNIKGVATRERGFLEITTYYAVAE